MAAVKCTKTSVPTRDKLWVFSFAYSPEVEEGCYEVNQGDTDYDISMAQLKLYCPQADDLH
jgi:hypothetical protein